MSESLGSERWFEGQVSEMTATGFGVVPVEHEGRRRVVFARTTAPGDRVVVRANPMHRTMYAIEVRITSPSQSRQSPPCRWVEQCGGCPLMHMTPAAAYEARTNAAMTLLFRRLPRPHLVMHHAAPCAVGYRTRARLHFAPARAPRRRGTLGFLAAESSVHVVGIDECVVLAPPLNKVLPVLASALEHERQPAEISVALAVHEPVVHISASACSAETLSRLDNAVSDGLLRGVLIRLHGARDDIRIGAPDIVTKGGDGLDLYAPPFGFAQTNEQMMLTLAERLDAALPEARGHIVELYAGAGTFTVRLARRFTVYTAVEQSVPATKSLAQNLAHRGLRHVRVIADDANRFPLPRDARIVVLDPPRSGAREASRRIAASSASTVAYISCDVGTLARDAEELAKGGFSPVSFETFDMFPQTAHLECLLVLKRSRT